VPQISKFACYINIFISRTEKEKVKFQQEVYELLAQIENAIKDKVIIQNLNLKKNQSYIILIYYFSTLRLRQLKN